MGAAWCIRGATNGGYDPSKFSGFAFGMGPQQITMLGHAIDDIRQFWGNDLRFLQQFNFQAQDERDSGDFPQTRFTPSHHLGLGDIHTRRKRWRVIISTLNSWLPGEPRGFRAQHEFILQAITKIRTTRRTCGAVSLQQVSGEKSGCSNELRLRSLESRSRRDESTFAQLLISVSATHCHLQVELPDDAKSVHQNHCESKRKASVAVLKQMPDRVWAHDGKYKAIDSIEHN